MTEALITPKMLGWARKRVNMSANVVADKLNIPLNRYTAWEAGTARPTFNQAQTLAKKFKIPFGYLFLDTPPKDSVDVPDLRTVGGMEPPSVDFIALYRDILRKQEWFKEYRLEEGGEPLPFVEAFSLRSGVPAVAASIRATLHFATLVNEIKDSDQLFNALISQAETAGILVMRNSVVGNNTRRPLSVEEFRGFAISDSYAPLVFINTADAKSAQLFTFAHELAHIWLGASGVSNPAYHQQQRQNRSAQTVEAFCNQVAAEVLVPEGEFLRDWHSDQSLDDNLLALAKKYRVSRLVLVRRAYDLACIDYETFDKYYLSVLKTDKDKKNRLSDNDGGPSTNIMTRLRNGRLLSQAVLSCTFEGKLLYRDAANLLGLKPHKLVPYAQSLEK